MNTHQSRFPAVSRWLHWLMAVMVLVMLFLGVGMAASVSERYRFLVAIHRPLGLAVLVLVAIRLINRLLNPPPPLPDSIPPLQRAAAKASHVFLYALMFIMPLIGWGMLSAAPYPIVIYGSLRHWSPEHFRATLQGYFLPASLLGMIGYWLAGLWVPAVTRYYFWSLPLALAAIFLGRAINQRMRGRSFLRYVHVGLLLVGTVLLLQSMRR